MVCLGTLQRVKYGKFKKTAYSELTYVVIKARKITFSLKGC